MTLPVFAPVPRLEIVRHQIGFLLDKGLIVFGKMVRAIPPEQLDFRATPATMRARELAHHAYQGLYLLTRVTETGTADFQALDQIPFDLDAATHPDEIVTYGQAVITYVRAALDGFTEADMDRPVENGPRPDGFATMNLAFEEVIHHRGQLSVYLRLMGVKPPFLYDYSS